ncbi:MAG: heparinase II/III domain-containing protein, partial [bacterium]
EPLLIDSGYYPYYGSPHHILWTRQTRAHNAILINWRGHSPNSMAARGRIEYFEQAGHITKMRAEDAEAYNTPPSEDTLDLWKENVDLPPPSMEPRAELARRTLAFVASEEHPWMAIHDYIKVDSPTSFQYMLHALEPMSFSQDTGQLSLTVGKAQFDIYLMS